MAFGLTGVVVGLVLGFLGAGGTVVGLPILLLFTQLKGHVVLGTNALGVALIAIFILIWRLFHREVQVLEGLVFILPGLVGIFVGVHLGLLYPGQRLILLLGVVIFVIAGWMFYLSTRKDHLETHSDSQNSNRPVNRRRLLVLIPTAFLIGAISGFFAIGGGFLIVPGLMLVGGLSLSEASATALLPIASFASLVGIEYLFSGSVEVFDSLIMLLPGILGGLLGIYLAKRIPKPTVQRIFAVLLVLIGVYMVNK